MFTSIWILNSVISGVLSPNSFKRAIAAWESASNDGYGSICWDFLFWFSFLSSTSFNSSSITSTFSSSSSWSSLVSLSDDVYSAIRLFGFNFFGDLLSVLVGGWRFFSS